MKPDGGTVPPAPTNKPAVIYVSPAEPSELFPLGETSSLPETMGCDFLFATPHGLVGIQRKAVQDLVASIRDDRLCRELGQSETLTQMVLLIEGDWRWDQIGNSRAVEGFSRAQLDGLLLSVQQEGWWVVFSESLRETVGVIRRIETWFSKAKHGSLRTRNKAAGAVWGSHTNRAWGCHWWQTIEGIGYGMAGVLYDTIGVPVIWTVTEEELLAIPGIGPGRAKRILESLPTG